MSLPEELTRTLDLIRSLTQKTRRDMIKFPVVLAAWNRAYRGSPITLPTLLKRIKSLSSMGLVEIVSGRSHTAFPGQVDIRKSSVRLLSRSRD
ncbi:MAG: hypothetical protein ACFFBD_03140 [Candidatus Hodarchaeota archaeon]